MHSNNKQFVEIDEKCSDTDTELAVDKEADMRKNSPLNEIAPQWELVEECHSSWAHYHQPQ
mgnify:FL=1